MASTPFINEGSTPNQFSRDVQISRKEFLKQLPAAIGNRQHEISGNRVVVKDGAKHVHITLIDEGAGDLGSLDLPMKKIEFDFRGHSQQEIEAFMKEYDEHTLRFGGM